MKWVQSRMFPPLPHELQVFIKVFSLDCTENSTRCWGIKKCSVDRTGKICRESKIVINCESNLMLKKLHQSSLCTCVLVLCLCSF